MTGSRILRCSCKYPYQDKKYGTQKRVHTVSTKKETARCTVCGKTQGIKLK